MTTEIIGMFYPLLLFILITVIVVALLWQGFATYRARAILAREEAYRKLAEQASTAEQKAAQEQQKIAIALDDLRLRVAAIEKILREVE
jgi:hypothetical protein